MGRTTGQPAARIHERPRALRPERRFWSHAALFAGCVLLVNGLIGERGLTEIIRARQVYNDAARDLARLKRENAALREAVRLLRDDPATLESLARRDLGLVRRGEILVTVRDLR
jgi:cell division protein FtsB